MLKCNINVNINVSKSKLKDRKKERKIKKFALMVEGKEISNLYIGID